MADVTIPFGPDNHDNAVLLIAAAEKLGVPRSQVRTKIGAFVVDEKVAAEAGLGEKKPAKKAAPAKKAPAKKAAAKKSAAKKSTKKSTKKAQE